MEEYFDKIEHYLAGTMPAEERSSFETELAQNKELKETLEAHRLAHDAMEVMVEDNLRTELKKMQADVYPIGEKGPSSEQHAKVVTLRRLWPRLAVAASVLLLVGFFTFQWAGSNYSTSAIAGDFYKPAELSNIVRSANSIEYILKEGENLIREANYTEALAALRTVPENSDYFIEAQYLMGLCLDQTGQREEARQMLANVINSDHANLPDEAEWLTLLSYLEAGQTDTPEYIALLNKISGDREHSYYAKATKLKRQMNSVWHKLVE